MTGDFQARAAAVRASRFVHEEQAFYAFTLDGRLYSLSADAFEALYAPLPEAAAAPTAAPPPKRQAHRSSTAQAPGAPQPQPVAGKKGAPTVSATSDTGAESGTLKAVFQAISEQPRTSAEVADRVCVLKGWDPKELQARQRVQSCLSAQKAAGKIEKFDDPNTQLPHWRLVNK